jgi:hypothetical protein
MANGSDIIIKGGSAEVIFDGDVYRTDPSNPRKHVNAEKRIVRVVITGDISFDSGDKSEGLECEITCFCR